MPGKRVALLVVTDTHVDPTFNALQAPRADADALAEVLRDPRIGGYTVETPVNRPADEVRRRLNRPFNEAERDDMLLRVLANTGWDRKIRIWNVADWRCVDTLVGHFGWVMSLAFSPDGRLLASGSNDGMVKLWDVTQLRR